MAGKPVATRAALRLPYFFKWQALSLSASKLHLQEKIKYT